MRKIGLLSDTHGYWDEKFLIYFEECDEIWHAGDIGSIEIVKRFEEFKKFRAVFGNIDGGDIRLLYPEINKFTLEGVDVFMTHIGGYPGRYNPEIKKKLYESPPRLFISGHSHILKVIYDKKIHCLHMNPGAAGKQGFHKVRTLLRFSLDVGDIKDLEVIELNDE